MRVISVRRLCSFWQFQVCTRTLSLTLPPKIQSVGGGRGEKEEEKEGEEMGF